MTAWTSERQAIENMIEIFGTGFFACVMDSYDYEEARFACSEGPRSARQMSSVPREQLVSGNPVEGRGGCTAWPAQPPRSC